MVRTYNVNSGAVCLRYIVPFKYNGSFKEAYTQVSKQASWTKKKFSTGGPESDLYEYIKNEFSFDGSNSEELAKEKAGCEWLYAKEKGSNLIKKLTYYPWEIFKEDIKEKEGTKEEDPKGENTKEKEGTKEENT